MDEFILRRWVTYMIVGSTLYLTLVTAIGSYDIRIEAELMDGVDPDRIIGRSNASGQRVVHLNQGEKLLYELCIMPASAIQLSALVYSNDGDSDTIHVGLDQSRLTTLQTSVQSFAGGGWNRFMSPMIGFNQVIALEGRHVLTLTVEDADKYGVDIDYMTLTFNTSQSLESISCQVFCFEKAAYDLVPPHAGVHMATAVQHSVQTKCAEEDNINIPVFHSSTFHFVKYEVTALLPKYTTFLNNRGPDWENCQMVSAFFNFTDITPRQQNETHYSSDGAKMQLNFQHGFMLTPVDFLGSIVISFNLTGPTVGHTDSEIGMVLWLKQVKFDGNILIKFEYFNRYDQWSAWQSKHVNSFADNVTFTTPDFSFREGGGNVIRLSLYSDHGKPETLSIHEIYMIKRSMKGDASKKLYQDANTVIEGVDIDMWWRINETMTINVDGPHGVDSFTNIDYFRIYQRVPWKQNEVSQVFVMYQDGNVRLLPITPHGLDWIPFGSSVIIGQTDRSDVRPYAAVTHVNIDPVTLNMTIFYADGGHVVMRVKSSFEDTKIVISDAKYARDSCTSPFFTFRSMFVRIGDCDVDHLEVDGGQSVGITDAWGSMSGFYFAFYRKCISQHNTLSPDITLNILQ